MNTNFTVKERGYEIKRGPSKDALIDAFKYAYAKSGEYSNPPLPLDFHVVVGYTGLPTDPTTCYIKARIENLRVISIQYEDGSGESFNIAGYCDADLSVGQRQPLVCYRFEAWYNTKRRIGHMRFISP